MKMKRRILLSLAIGIVLTLTTLIYKSGSDIVPAENFGGDIFRGAPIINDDLALQPSPLAQRGLPFPVASNVPDSLTSGYLYKSINVRYLLLDIAVFSVVGYGFTYLIDKNMQLRKPKKGKPISRPAKK